MWSDPVCDPLREEIGKIHNEWGIAKGAASKLIRYTSTITVEPSNRVYFANKLARHRSERDAAAREYRVQYGAMKTAGCASVLFPDGKDPIMDGKASK